MIIVYQCPSHPTFVTLCVQNGDGIGTRIGGSKCCIRQYTKVLKTWPVERIGQDLLDELKLAMAMEGLL